MPDAEDVDFEVPRIGLELVNPFDFDDPIEPQS
jgi:hypothetical protein